MGEMKEELSLVKAVSYRKFLYQYKAENGGETYLT